MSAYNRRYWGNKPKPLSRSWWRNWGAAPWNVVDADGNFIWEGWTFSPVGGREYPSDDSRYWNWWKAQP